jgi:hypothetical protein
MRMEPTAPAVTVMLILKSPAASAVTGGCAAHPEAGPAARPRAWVFRRTVLVACACAAVLGMLVIAPAAATASVNITTTEGRSFTGNVATGLVCPLLSATITWGDATTSAGTSDGGTGIRGTHTYAEEGTYSGSVSYTYTAGGVRSCPTGVQTASFQATVNDALLTAGGTNVSGIAGQPTSGVVAHFTDANPGAGAGDFSAAITWGDGTKSFGTVAAAPAGGFDVSGTHTYNTVGSYPISTSVTDIGGSTAGASSAAQIAAPAPPPPPPPPQPNITARFIVNPASPCLLTKTLLDARDSTLVPGGTDTEYDWAIDEVDPAFQTLSPVFDATDALPYDNSRAVYRGQVTRDVPGFGPTVYSVFRVHVLAAPVQVSLTVYQVVPGRGEISASSPDQTITFTNPDESLLIGYPGPSLFDTPPVWVVNPGQRHGCPAITARRFFGIKAVSGSVALARVIPSPVVLNAGRSIKLQAGCQNPVKDCFASLDVLSRAARLSHGVRTRVHRSLPPSLGSKTFVLPAGKTTSVTVPLNARGRALARAHKLRRVTLLLGSVGAGGKIMPTIRTVRLRAR